MTSMGQSVQRGDVQREDIKTSPKQLACPSRAMQAAWCRAALCKQELQPVMPGPSLPC